MDIVDVFYFSNNILNYEGANIIVVFGSEFNSV